MSRKTRKLIWSVPLVAVLAVVGALVIFAALSPQEASAHEAAMHGLPGPVTGLDANPATDNPGTGELEGRSAITLTWNAPDTAASGTPTGYRIDYSDDTRVWRNLVPNLSEAMADANCGTSADADQRCYTNTGLDPNKLRYYRVFTMSGDLTGPVSADPTYDFATTVDYADPSVVRVLTATTYHRGMIDLTWQAPMDNGGAEVMWYCLQVGALDTDFPALRAEDCLNATEATDIELAAFDTAVSTLADGSAGTNPTDDVRVVIVVPATQTTFSHTGLGGRAVNPDATPPITTALPDVLSLRYRVYAVTDKDGKANTANAAADDEAAAVTDQRRISMAASNTAIGMTRAGLPDVTTPITVKPGRVQNLRYVVYVAGDGDAQMNLYWQMPANYPAAEPMKADNWSIRVDKLGPDGDDADTLGDWGEITGAVADAEDGTERGLGLTQFAVIDTDINSVPGDDGDDLTSGPMTFRVLYNNDHDADVTFDTGDSGDTDPIEGSQYSFTVLQINATDHAEGDLPVINDAVDRNNTVGLRFAHNGTRPTTAIDILWDADENDNMDVPTGYVLEVSYDDGDSWGPLANVATPTDLGATRRYTHQGRIPGKRYTYRVFPEFRSGLGMPEMVDASSREDALPGQVQGLKVVADGEDALKLTWTALSKAGKHDVKGYLVQIASSDIINNNTTLTSLTNTDYSPAVAPEWLNLRVNTQAGPDAADRVGVTVGADKTTYTYRGIDITTTDRTAAQIAANAVQNLDGTDNNGFVDDLSASNVRWFRVIAITDENDGDDGTGGMEVSLSTGVIQDGSTEYPTEPSPAEALPEPDDLGNALAKYGRTASPASAPGQDVDAAPAAPVDLTAEKASDTDLAGAEERGVLLLWNEPKKAGAGGITSYVIERRIDGGTELTIDAITWANEGDPDQRTSYTDPREPVAGETLEYRVGSRGSAVTETQWADWIMYPTDHHVSGDLTTVNGLTATAGSTAGTAEVSWTPGANATMHWIYAIRADEMEGGYTFMQASSNNSHTLTGLDRGVEYIVGISAGTGQLMADGGDGGEWSAWMLTRVTPD